MDEAGEVHAVECGGTWRARQGWAFGWRRRRQGVPDLQHVVDGQLLDHELKHNGLAKDDGRVGRGNPQQRYGTEARITVVDEHVRQGLDGAMVIECAGTLWLIPLVKMLHLLGARMKKTLKKGMGSWFKNAHLYRSKAIEKWKCACYEDGSCQLDKMEALVGSSLSRCSGGKERVGRTKDGRRTM